MLLVAVLIMLVGIGGCLAAVLRAAHSSCSPLFENSLVVALVGLVLVVAAAAVEAAREGLTLAGSIIAWFQGG